MLLDGARSIHEITSMNIPFITILIIPMGTSSHIFQVLYPFCILPNLKIFHRSLVDLSTSYEEKLSPKLAGYLRTSSG
jgi:hypothetical protein